MNTFEEGTPDALEHLTSELQEDDAKEIVEAALAPVPPDDHLVKELRELLTKHLEVFTNRSYREEVAALARETAIDLAQALRAERRDLVEEIGRSLRTRAEAHRVRAAEVYWDFIQDAIARIGNLVLNFAGAGKAV